MRFQRLVAEFTAAVACLVFAAGCTSSPSEPEPLPEPTRSSAASQSPSPNATTTPPTLPAEAEGTSPAAAKAFARHYFDLVNYAMATGDTSQLRSVADEECESCNAIAGNVEEIYSSGGRIESEGWDVTNVRIVDSASGRAVLSLGVHLNDEVVISADGKREQHDGTNQPMTMRLREDQETFRVIRLDFVT